MQKHIICMSSYYRKYKIRPSDDIPFNDIPFDENSSNDIPSNDIPSIQTEVKECEGCYYNSMKQMDHIDGCLSFS